MRDRDCIVIMCDSENHEINRAPTKLSFAFDQHEFVSTLNPAVEFTAPCKGSYYLTVYEAYTRKILLLFSPVKLEAHETLRAVENRRIASFVSMRVNKQGRRR